MRQCRDEMYMICFKKNPIWPFRHFHVICLAKNLHSNQPFIWHVHHQSSVLFNRVIILETYMLPNSVSGYIETKHLQDYCCFAPWADPPMRKVSKRTTSKPALLRTAGAGKMRSFDFRKDRRAPALIPHSTVNSVKGVGCSVDLV